MGYFKDFISDNGIISNNQHGFIKIKIKKYTALVRQNC